MSTYIGSLQPPLEPRDGRTLRILSVCRVSSPGPGKQDIRSLEDQEALHRRWLDSHNSLPYRLEVLAGSGSGESLEREEYTRVIEMIESEEFDLVLAEDLGRIVRRIHAHLLCELCVDHGVRLIAINDHVDTAEPGWQDRSFFSAWHHERSNRDTSDRIKRTHRSRFFSGGSVPLPIYGYVKKPGAKSDADWEKLPEAESIYREWFDRLDQGASYAEIADSLNEKGVPTGPYTRQSLWTCQMVSRVTHNWILKGTRFHNKRKTKRRNSSGTYVAQKATPDDLLLRSVPHLAFFDADYYDAVVAKADARNAKFRRTDENGRDPCANRPKKRVRFPGQSIYCGVCGRLFVFGGHGQKDRLMCSGAREHTCWNGATLDGPLATERICEAVFATVEALPDFDAAFLEMVSEEAREYDAAQHSRLQETIGKIRQVEREVANLVTFIRGGDGSDSVRGELARLETQLKQLRHEKSSIERAPTKTLNIPGVDEIKQIAREAFKDLAISSFQFAALLRQITGPIMVWPFQAVDGGPVVLRAKLQICLSNLLPDTRLQAVLCGPLTREVRLDLFVSPQHIELREQVIAGRKEANEAGRKRTEREVAQELGITVTAAQRAAKLGRRMLQLSLQDPYGLLTQPPCCGKNRRHLHSRYRFDPLPGHSAAW